MNGKDLFQDLSYIELALVEEAQESIKPAGKRIRSLAAMAACLCVLIGAGFFATHFLGGRSEAPGFMSYMGPVMPLTLEKAADGITCDREMVYDFDSFRPEEETYTDETGNTIAETSWDSRITVTDSYLLQNTTGEDQNLTLLYPYTGSLREMDGMPSLSVNGQPAEPELLLGPYSGIASGEEKATHGGLHQAQNWEDYQQLLSDGSYLQEALCDFPQLQQKATAYCLSDPAVLHGEGEAPTLAVNLQYDPDQTKILSYGFNGMACYEEGNLQLSFFLPREGEIGEGKPVYWIAVGEEPLSYSLQGYQDGSCTVGEELEIKATVQQQEVPLQDILASLTEDFRRQYLSLEEESAKVFEQWISNETLCGAVTQVLNRKGAFTEEGRDRYDTVFLEDVISETVFHKRVFYLRLPVTVPAGETLQVEAVLPREPNCDFAGAGSQKEGIYGYDLVTNLGSNLTFRQVPAELVHNSWIEFVSQNFEWDPQAGVCKVELSPEQEYYYMEIRRKEL